MADGGGGCQGPATCVGQAQTRRRSRGEQTSLMVASCGKGGGESLLVTFHLSGNYGFEVCFTVVFKDVYSISDPDVGMEGLGGGK